MSQQGLRNALGSQPIMEDLNRRRIWLECCVLAQYEVVDFGNEQQRPDDDYPDFVVPLARAVARGEVHRGVAICGGGVGACIAANKVPCVLA
jgi:RpiB/LacA/LacB family sugar-phosphate isomerase